MSAAAVIVALVAWGTGASWLAVTDHRTRMLPTRVIRWTAGAVWILWTAASLLESEPAGLLGAVIGAAVCGGILAVVHFANRASLGFGDVRLAALNGLLCGWWGWRAALAALAAGFLLAFPQAVITLIRQGRRASRALGPHLIVGTAGVAAWSAVTEGLVPFMAGYT